MNTKHEGCGSIGTEKRKGSSPPSNNNNTRNCFLNSIEFSCLFFH